MRLRRKLHGLILEPLAGASARDYFVLFHIEPEFQIDMAALERAYHTLLSQFHPDLFAGKPQVEQRVAAQLCADINSGFRVLSSEVLRAEYLLKRAGVDLAQAEKEGVGAAFLMTQIALRERLESADSAHSSERDALSVEIRDRYNASRDAFASAAEDERFKEAACYWQEMCYLSKLRDATRVRAA